MPDLFVNDLEKNSANQNTPDQTLKLKEEKIKEDVVGRIESLKKGSLRYPKNDEEAEKLPGHTHNPLASFNYFPGDIDFINKDPEEKIILIVRRHPITNLKWILISFAMIILPSFVSVLPFFEEIPKNFFILIFLSWYMVVLGYVLENFLNWYFSTDMVTDERVFDVDFYNLIYRKITDAKIEQIQEVTVNIGGGLRTVFNYGDVLIQTASEIPELIFEAVPTPDHVAKILRELRVEEEVEEIEDKVK